MPRPFIKSLTTPGHLVEGVFQVAEKDLRTTKKGSYFITGRLRDRTGEVPAIMWDATEALFAAIPQGGFVLVKGRVGEYNDRPQIVIEALRPARDAEVDPSDFLPVGPGNPQEDLARLKSLFDEHLERPALRGLMDAVWADEELMEDLARAPAAEKLHHAYIGGLVEHTLSVAELAVLVCRHYPQLDRDLLLVGVFWHDLGKTRELAYEKALGYTDSGRLVGHLIQGVLMLDQKVREVRAAGTDFPELLADVVRHLVLAHHGEYEFGSPKLPMTAEAFVLHHIDNLDAKLHAFERETAGDADPERRWTAWNRMFGGRLFKGLVEPAEEGEARQ